MAHVLFYNNKELLKWYMYSMYVLYLTIMLFVNEMIEMLITLYLSTWQYRKTNITITTIDFNYQITPCGKDIVNESEAGFLNIMPRHKTRATPLITF